MEFKIELCRHQLELDLGCLVWCLQFGILLLLCRNAFLITCWVLDSDLCSCIVTLDADVSVLLQTEDAFIVVEDEDAEACFKDCRC